MTEPDATASPAPAADDRAVGPPPAVVTRALVKRYGSHRAVDGLDLTVPAGVVYGLIGPNGAGKTTTFSILASLLRPTSGSAEVDGIDVGRAPRRARRRIGFMPDVLGVYDRLGVEEYLRFFAATYRIRGRSATALVDGLLELVDLQDKRAADVNSLSRGMKQRLSLARALIHDPAVLLLDEPASGLDPRARVELRELVRELQAMGKTIVVSSHILVELQEMCDQIGVMLGGRLLTSGPAHEILHPVGATRRVVVRFADGGEEEHVVLTDEEQERLLARFVADGRRPVEYREVGVDLDELFLALTEGAR